MEEIDRIEVVEGPASALYGANAIAGVINIITKTPERLKGGTVEASAGEAGFRSGSALYGARKGKFYYKVAMGERAGNGFQNEGVQASQSGNLPPLPARAFPPRSPLNAPARRTQTAH